MSTRPTAVPARALVLCLAVIGAPPARAQQPALPDSIAVRVDSAVAVYMSARHVPGLSLAVAVDGHIVMSRGYGLASLETFTPVTPRSVFRTASIGKPMTATAALQLWEQQKLDLDAPIQRYCPAFPQKRWPITTRQLLSHTAGIRDKTAAEETNYRHFDTIVEALSVFANDTLESRPGTRYRYTSYGYDVVGCVIEGASGMPYLDYMSRFVFAPAGMGRTRVDDPRVIVPNRVSGYRLDERGGLVNSIHDDMSNRIPAGGFVSTAEDLVRCGIAVIGGKLVSDSARRVMVTVPNGADGRPLEDAFYALGWATGDWYGVQELSHGGGTPQVTAMLYLLPARGFIVAFMMNLESVPDRGDFAGDLAKLVLGPRAPHR
jgi:CubicO group peptidase (beta-lactamase class C family)